jgi:hypothetical protein
MHRRVSKDRYKITERKLFVMKLFWNGVGGIGVTSSDSWLGQGAVDSRLSILFHEVCVEPGATLTFSTQG